MPVEGVCNISELRIRFPPGVLRVSNITLPIPSNFLIKNILRTRHPKINSDYLLLDEKVSREYFRKVVKEIEENKDSYEKIWKVKEIFFPNVFIDVLSPKGNVLLIISLNLRNYNYYPPQVGFLTPDKSLILSFKPDVVIQDDEGRRHLIADNQGAWVCMPGTYKYHNWYFDIDRWELDRYNPDNSIVNLINRLVNMIDRTKEL